MNREQMQARHEQLMTTAKKLQMSVAQLPPESARRQESMLELQRLHTERLRLQRMLNPKDTAEDEGAA